MTLSAEPRADCKMVAEYNRVFFAHSDKYFVKWSKHDFNALTFARCLWRGGPIPGIGQKYDPARQGIHQDFVEWKVNIPTMRRSQEEGAFLQTTGA